MCRNLKMTKVIWVLSFFLSVSCMQTEVVQDPGLAEALPGGFVLLKAAAFSKCQIVKVTPSLYFGGIGTKELCKKILK